MPFPMKIQPLDSDQLFREPPKPAPVFKSRLKRLFDRPFNSVLRVSSTEQSSKSAPFSTEVVKDSAGIVTAPAGVSPEFEPSSVCLDKMVQNFIEENNNNNHFEKQPQKCGKNNRCNCFNGNNTNDSSDDEIDDFGFCEFNGGGDSIDSLKSLIPCSTTMERNLLADTSRIVEKNKSCKRKDDLRKIVTDGLIALGFNASICKSKWDKSSSIPAGEYEYIDVINEGERVLIDVDFRSEFEIARSTGSYKAILQSLPFIFVGNVDRLQQIIAIVSEAAKESLKKKGMHVAPWRKVDYMKAKWLSPPVRTSVIPPQDDVALVDETRAEPESKQPSAVVEDLDDESEECAELELIFGEKMSFSDEPPKSFLSSPVRVSGEGSKGLTPVTMTWQPPVIKPKSCERGNRVMVTGLASLLKEKP